MIDWSKPIKTIDGKSVRVLCTNGPNSLYPIVVIIEDNIDIVVLNRDGHLQKVKKPYVINIFEQDRYRQVPHYG